MSADFLDELEVQTERLDDIPVLYSVMRQTRVAEIIDRYCHPHGNRRGLSYGDLAVVWLCHILSQSTHAMNPVEEWSITHQSMLRRLLGKPVSDQDFTDDRLADLLRVLSQERVWFSIESDLSRQSIRVYDLKASTIRLDASTFAVDHDPQAESLFQVGRHKDGSFRVLFKMMLATLDPLGMPLACQLVSGNTNDDPLYLPIYEQTRQLLNDSGYLYVGDCKMAALQTRGTIAAQGDYYLMPLPLTEPTVQLLEQALAPIGEPKPVPAVLFADAILPETLSAEERDDWRIAEGFEIERPQSLPIQGAEYRWSERCLIIRSDSYAQSQLQNWRQKLEKTQRRLQELTPPPASRKKQYDQLEELQQKVKTLLTDSGLTEVFSVEYERQTYSRVVKKAGHSGTEDRVRYQLHLQRNETVIAHREQRWGWRIYLTNAARSSLSLNQALLSYRQEYLVERNFGRLKGKQLSITPMYLQREDHTLGLACLLTLALRILTLIEFTVRKALRRQAEKLQGIYKGNPKRSTASPTTEMMLKAFVGITLTLLITPQGIQKAKLSPLHGVQIRILELMGLSPLIYTSLTQTAFPRSNSPILDTAVG